MSVVHVYSLRQFCSTWSSFLQKRITESFLYNKVPWQQVVGRMGNWAHSKRIQEWEGVVHKITSNCFTTKPLRTTDNKLFLPSNALKAHPGFRSVINSKYPVHSLYHWALQNELTMSTCRYIHSKGLSTHMLGFEIFEMINFISCHGQHFIHIERYVHSQIDGDICLLFDCKI